MKTIKILYCKDLWWPFGSHLLHCMYRKIFCDINDYKLCYCINPHPAYSLYDGRINEYFALMNDELDDTIIEFANKNFSKETNHFTHFLLEFSDKNEFLSSTKILLNEDIGKSDWDTFYSSKYLTAKEYQAAVMTQLAEPTDNIKKHLNDSSFIQEISKLEGNYIAIHIRWTDMIVGRHREGDFYDVDVYYRHALELKKHLNVKTVVLCCDNIDAVNRFLEYNASSGLEFDVLYDKEVKLPPNVPDQCVVRKWEYKKSSNEELVQDTLNGFKVYKILKDSAAVVGDWDANWCAVPIVARNNKFDINVAGNRPGNWMSKQKFFTKEIMQERQKYKLLEESNNNKQHIANKSFSQFKQDLNVLDFYKNKKNGFFVEIGAADGIRYSNTYLLETEYNWKGICVEPISFSYEKLIKNRPNCMNSNKAVYSKTAEQVPFDISKQQDLLSGISEHIGLHKKTVEKDKETVIVETITLVDLLAECNAPNFIDYLSIDTEGSEYEILRVHDFTKYKFGLIDVEVNNEEPKRSLLRNLLLANGYKLHSSNQCDDTYVCIELI